MCDTKNALKLAKNIIIINAEKKKNYGFDDFWMFSFISDLVRDKKWLGINKK